MSTYYLGYVVFIRPEFRYGRIRPLAILTKRTSDSSWVVDHPCSPGDLGSTERVFWPKIPNDQVQLQDCYVRFRVEPNQKLSDSEGELDEYRVAEEWQNGKGRRVYPIGLEILSEDLVTGAENAVDPGCRLRPESPVYQGRLKGTLIRGPWRVVEQGELARLCLQPKDEEHVWEYRFPLLPRETYCVWDDGDTRRTVLLVEPPKSAGSVIDLLPDTALADWLIRVLKRDRPLLTHLDQASLGWRDRIRQLLADQADPARQALDDRRYGRLEAALEKLARNEARLADLVELPRFKEILDDAVRRELAARREQIEADARMETRRVVDEEGRLREQARLQTERAKQGLERKLEKVRADIAEAERLRDEVRAKAERDESLIRSAADYLVESRGRIVCDLYAFQALVDGARTNGIAPTDGQSAVIALASAPASPGPIEPAPTGPPIDSPAAFVECRLIPALASWSAAAAQPQARRLHAALLACRWVAAPCPSWGVAYVEALGLARHRVVPVAPTWLNFADAWAGEMEDFWRQAVGDRDVLHLLIFADADRALVPCWGRPLLDVISGLRDTLPSGLPWPENLRVMASPSADEAALPVPDWVVAHWAGVKPSAGTTRPDGPIRPGHVPFSAWSGWIAEPREIPTLSAGVGVAARSAARDRAVLARILLELEPDGDPILAELEARTIREVDARTVFSVEDRR